MPFKVVKQGGLRPWKVIRKDTGEIVGSSTSKRNAIISAWKRTQGSRDLKR